MKEPHATATVTVLVEEEGQDWTRTVEQEREYRIPLTTFRKLALATNRHSDTIVDLFDYHYDLQKYSHADLDGWAVDLPDGATVSEALPHSITVSAAAPAVYRIATDDDPSPEKLYARLKTLAAGDRPIGAATEALLAYIHENTGAVDREDMDGWEVPDTHFEMAHQ